MSTDSGGTEKATDRKAATEEKPSSTKHGASYVEEHVRKHIMDGFFELVPLLVTIAAIAFLVGYADALIRPIIRLLGLPTLDFTIGGLSFSLGADFWGVGAIVLLIIFYLVGVLLSFAVGRRIMNSFSGLLSAFPIVKLIFGMMKRAMTSIRGTQTNFSRVVFVEWPREGMMALGFVTGRIYSPETNASMVSVYIPTIPNPTSGNMAFVFEDDVIETNLNPEDAMRLVFSGGIVLPDTVNLARLSIALEEHRVSELVGTFKTISTPAAGDDQAMPAVSQKTTGPKS